MSLVNGSWGVTKLISGWNQMWSVSLPYGVAGRVVRVMFRISMSRFRLYFELDKLSTEHYSTIRIDYFMNYLMISGD